MNGLALLPAGSYLGLSHGTCTREGAPMPKRRSRPRHFTSPPGLAVLAVSALLVFLLGEAWLLSRSDRAQIALARRVGVGDPARVTRIVGRHVRGALIQAGVPRDSVRESVPEGGRAALRWRIGLAPEASGLQINYAVNRTLEAIGAEVLEGREGWDRAGAATVTLLVGLPKRPTHELVLVRGQPAGGQSGAEPARLALVLYGFGEEAARADSFFALPAPFAVAVVAGLKSSPAVVRAAHHHGREVILQLPLEPINYPQVNPGPGTLTVTMKPAKIASEVRRYVDQARPLAAVANYMGSLATQDMTVMSAVYRELRRSRLPFLHLTPVAGAVCKSLAADVGVAYEEPDLVIEAGSRGTDPAALERCWQEALRTARERGELLVFLRATPLALRWLPRTLTRARLEGVQVVPPSALLRRPVA
jgi:polysaccharide deacetylase 2 family uncharacterized protein YibQ